MRRSLGLAFYFSHVRASDLLDRIIHPTSPKAM
jgi:hypothetical protein